MKKITNIFLLLFLFFIAPSIVFADYSAIINGNSVRIRKSASTSGTILYTVNVNTNISVLDKTKVSGSGCSSGWLKVSYKDKTGYVCSSYVTYVDTTFNDINTTPWTARVNANNVAVRKSADANSTSLNTLTLGANVTILKEVSGKSDSCSGGKWYQIQYYGSKTGYMCKNYVTKKESITANDSEYANVLKEAGFTDGYIPFLTYLHNKYPNWKFNAKDVKKDFAYSVSMENGKNYMQTTNDSYRTSSKPAESDSWFYVNSGVIAFYLDPRNWLSEERIFMFEKLDYDTSLESLYPSLVKSVFGSGKLSDDKYTIPMVNAGKTNKISPVLIASRIRVEVGADGSDSTNGCEFTWKDKTYSGYYNFFNIGAYQDTIDGVKVNSVKRGLLYAAKLISRSGSVWNNIETAITEGSEFLANGYVNNGQGTLYYQKFNVSPSAYYDSFTHQYMTNIQAPATEGNKAYSSYKSNKVLDTPFVFEIPVYKNMPEYTSLPKSGDTNNYLKTLTVDEYSISPVFDKDVLTYEVYVPLNLEKVNVSATTESSLATITGNGEIELKTDETIVTITVLSETQEERKYTITIKKIDNSTNSNQIVSASYNVNDSYITKLKNGITADTILNNLIKNGAQSAVIKNSSDKEITGNNIICTGYTLTITTLVDTKEYTLVVKGDTSGDGKVTALDLLQVRKQIKGKTKLNSASKLAADTSGDNKITALDLLQIRKHIKGVKSL